MKQAKNSLFAGLFFYDAKITQMWRKDAYLREYSANIEYGADLETNSFAPELFLWCGFETGNLIYALMVV